MKGLYSSIGNIALLEYRDMAGKGQPQRKESIWMLRLLWTSS